MKRSSVFKLFVAVAVAATLLVALPKSAQAAQSGDFAYYIVNGNEVTIWRYYGSGGAVTIPAKIEGLSVTSIGDSAFLQCAALTGVTIPSGVRHIESDAFFGCTGLKSVAIPNGVIDIGDSAFFGCTGLASVSIPGSVTGIGDLAFECCSGLTSVTIPSSVQTIGGVAFCNCPSLKSITVASSNPSYSSIAGVLYSKDQKTLICCPSGIKGAFTVPTGVTAIEGSAFSFDAGLVSITLPDSIADIGGGAFSDCDGLTHVTIPGKVKTINSSLFNGCDKLTGVTLPSGLTAIGDYAFFKCISLSDITIPTGVATIAEMAFDGCTSLTKINLPGGITQIGDGAFLNTGLTSVTIPGGITRIESETFASCTSLTSITIPVSVNYIGLFAFYECSSLSSAYFMCNAPDMDTYVFDKCASNFSVQYLYGRTGYTNPWYGYPAHQYTPAGMAVVLFNSQGGSAVSYKLAKLNTAVLPPAAPSRAGYAFLGWYREAVCTTPWNFSSDKVTGNITLFAKWAALPAVPTGVKAVSASYNSIRLTWNAVSGAAGYEVWRIAPGASAYSPLGTATSASFTDTNLLCGTRYVYKVRAYKWSGTTKVCGSLSAYAYAAPIPAAPASPKATPAANKSITVSWSAVAGATMYEVWHCTTSYTGTYTFLASTTLLSFTNTGLTTGKSYYYKIRAYRLVGSTKVYGEFSGIIYAKP